MHGDSDDFDFDDLLDSFERKFAKKLAQRSCPDDFNAVQKALRPVSVTQSDDIDVTEYQGELKLLLLEVQQLSQQNRASYSRTGPQNHGDSAAPSLSRMESSIEREVLRAEIRTTLQKLRSSDFPGDDSEKLSRPQQAIVASLKRQVREANDEVQRLTRANKHNEIQARNLHDVADSQSNKLSMLEEKVTLLESQKKEREAILSESAAAMQSLRTDKARLERNLAMLRTELLDSHHRITEQKMLISHWERQVIELKARLAEMRSSETVLSERVRELHEVQTKMLEEMKKVVDSKDAPAAQKALANLTQQRVRILGKIGTILSKRNHGDNERPSGSESTLTNPNHAGNEQTTHSVGESTAMDTFDEMSDAENSQSPTGAAAKKAITQMSADDGTGTDFNRKGSILTFFKGGSNDNGNSEVVGRPSNHGVFNLKAPDFGEKKRLNLLSKNDRHVVYENNLERSREAAERDADALRDVVDTKSLEIERLENELRTFSEQNSRLQRELHSERQHRRKENRNLHIPTEEDPIKQRGIVAQQRSKPHTLFDWQTS